MRIVALIIIHLFLFNSLLDWFKDSREQELDIILKSVEVQSFQNRLTRSFIEIITFVMVYGLIYIE